jgi:hypothetical protein
MNVPLFEAMADLLIPAGPDMPSASHAGVGRQGLTEVLGFRPELKATIESILKQCERKPAKDALATLSASDFATLAEVVASAYFMNEEVRAKLHYQGQRAKPIVPEEIEPELLKPVIDRGPIYRAPF